MIDDQDMCEWAWANVSFCTGSSGWSQTKFRAIKWLCVCVSADIPNIELENLLENSARFYCQHAFADGN